MGQDWLWQAFCQTGRIEDYLRYREAENAVKGAPGQGTTPIKTSGVAGAPTEIASGKEPATDAAHHRRPDSAGEQPYR